MTDENHWWNEDVPERTKEDVRTAFRNANSLASLKQTLYEVSGEFDQSPFEKDVEFYVEIIDEMLDSADQGEEWDEYWNEKLPEDVRSIIKELYQDMKSDDSDDDDIIEA